MKSENEPNVFSSDHMHIKWQQWAHCFCPVLSGVKSRTRSCRPNAAKATPRNDAVSPCSLSSSSPLRVSLYPALRNLPTVQVVCSPKSFRRVHCTLRTAPPAFASLSALLIQLYNYRSSRPVPASSIIRASTSSARDISQIRSLPPPDDNLPSPPNLVVPS
jgi:hypothetical protein